MSILFYLLLVNKLPVIDLEKENINNKANTFPPSFLAQLQSSVSPPLFLVSAPLIVITCCILAYSFSSTALLFLILVLCSSVCHLQATVPLGMPWHRSSIVTQSHNAFIVEHLLPRVCIQPHPRQCPFSFSVPPWFSSVFLLRIAPELVSKFYIHEYFHNG